MGTTIHRGVRTAMSLNNFGVVLLALPTEAAAKYLVFLNAKRILVFDFRQNCSSVQQK